MIASSRLFLFCGKIFVEVMRLANFPQYNYQPQQMAYVPNVYPQYQQQPQYQPQQNQQPQSDTLVCRVVSGPEEARASQIDFSGRPYTFLDPRQRRVYVKSFNVPMGTVDFDTYAKIDPEETQAPAPVNFAPMSVVEELRGTIEELRAEVTRLKATRRRAQPQEVTEDEV